MTFRLLRAKAIFLAWFSREKRRRKTRVFGNLVVKRAGVDYGNTVLEVLVTA